VRPIVRRDLCLTIPAGTDGTYQCGDLQLSHTLPSVRTLGVDRAPTLVYNSAVAQPHPLVAYNLTLSSIPDSVAVTLTINGVENDRRSWPGNQWTTGTERRIILGSQSALATGLYTYQLDFQSFVGQVPSTTRSPVTGQIIIVNRKLSPYGAGWWVAGVEQLRKIAGDTLMLWVGGDGSAKV
jgi:hypothetical protein